MKMYGHIEEIARREYSVGRKLVLKVLEKTYRTDENGEIIPQYDGAPIWYRVNVVYGTNALNERERTNHYGGNEEKARKYFVRNN